MQDNFIITEERGYIMFTIISNFFDWVAQSKFWSACFLIIFLFFMLRIIFDIMLIIGNIKTFTYLMWKEKKLSIEKDMNSNISMPDRVELTNSILDLITYTINQEITSTMQPYIQLSQQFPINNIDIAIKNISNNVFNAVDKDMFSDPDLLLTSEYLQKFITAKTKNAMLDVVTRHNDAVRTVISES
jgi:hypothetical protein